MAAWLVCVSGDKSTFDFIVSKHSNTEFPEQKCRTYMSIVEEPVFAGNFVRCRLASGYVDRPRVGVDLLSQHRFQPRHQQDQQRRECELQQPEPAAYRGRARSHGVFLVQHGLWAQYRGRPRCMQVHRDGQRMGMVTVHLEKKMWEKRKKNTRRHYDTSPAYGKFESRAGTQELRQSLWFTVTTKM